MAFLIGASEQYIYPIAAVRDGIVFPSTENVLIFGRLKSVAAINAAMKKDKKIILLMQKNPTHEDPLSTELHHIGVLATIEKTAVGEKGEINALVKGREKVKLLNFTKEDQWFEGKVQIIHDEARGDEEKKT